MPHQVILAAADGSTAGIDIHKVRYKQSGPHHRHRKGQNMTPSTTVTMSAILQDAYGTADTWHAGQIAVPEITDKEVLVQIAAAGLDRGTWHLMTGLPYLGRVAFGIRKPKNPVPGRDLAGTVAAVGSSVTRFSVDDTVFGIGLGSFAECAAAREDKLARTPTNLTLEQAAVVPISGLTALHALRDAGHVEAGQNVLIVGASGGVGSYAVQIAKSFGANVTGVCSTAKVDLVRSLGADQVIDYTQADFAHGTEHYDLIIDIGGSSPLSRLRRALTHTGVLVIVGGEGGGKLTGMGRHRDTECRLHLPTWPSSRRDASTRRRRGARQDRHHRLTAPRTP